MKIIDIIIIILTLISIGVVIGYLLGDGPTFEQALLVMIISYLFVINAKVIKNGMRLNFIEKNVADSFIKIKEDIDLIKKKLKV